MSGPEASPHTDDGFLNRRLTIRQPENGPRSGMDAVMLAAAVSRTDGPGAPEGDVMDAGAGSGVAALCLAHRLPGLSITGVEIQPDLAALLEHNIRANDMQGRVRAVCADLTAPMRQLKPHGLAPETFSHILTNPPFHKSGTVSAPQNPATAKARLMKTPGGGLSLWIRRCRTLLKPDGTLTIIHRADALTELLDAVVPQFAGLSVIPLHPAADRPAGRVIVRARRGGQTSLAILPPLILHAPDGSFTPQADAILRDGAPLSP